MDHSQPKAKRAKLKRKNDMEKAEKLGTSVQPKRQRVRPGSEPQMLSPADGHRLRPHE